MLRPPLGTGAFLSQTVWTPKAIQLIAVKVRFAETIRVAFGALNTSDKIGDIQEILLKGLLPAIERRRICLLRIGILFRHSQAVFFHQHTPPMIFISPEIQERHLFPMSRTIDFSFLVKSHYRSEDLSRNAPDKLEDVPVLNLRRCPHTLRSLPGKATGPESMGRTPDMSNFKKPSNAPFSPGSAHY